MALVDQLLGPQHTRRVFRTVGTSGGPTGCCRGSSADSRAFRTGLQTYLTTALSANRPYDQVCAELITASGTNDPTAVGFQRRHQLSARRCVKSPRPAI